MRLRAALRTASLVARVGAGAIALGRLARAGRAAPAVRPTATPVTTIGVVIPARDEAERIGPLLDAVVGAPGVTEVIVVDDGSSDGTGDRSRRAGAVVIEGRPLPDGWVGKAWALQQGIEATASDWVVTLDADTRPDPRLPTALVTRAIGDRFDLVTVGGRFDCPTPGARWLHAAMLTTLVYRFGPPGVPARPGREMANGQCMAFRRREFLDPEIFDAAGMVPVADQVVEDVALARHLAANGGRVGFLDGTELLTVRMFESLGDVWRGWGRSLALPGVEDRRRQLFDLAVILLAQVMPLPRLLLRRADLVDVALVACRLGTLVGTRTAYDRRGPAYWSSPLADLPAALAIALGIRRGTNQTWRGRRYC
jgi:dolichol-phosphate mannosyltransferase